MDVWKLLFDIVLLLTGALVLGGLCTRLKQSPLVGYLVAGMLLGGPGSLRLISEGRDVETIAELGVALLLFSLGLEFSWPRLAALGRPALQSGVVQIVVTAFVGAVGPLLVGLPLRESVAVGAMVALSSTACVLRVLMDQGDIDSVHGRWSLAILLVQDLAVVPLAVLMTLLAGQGTAGELALHVGEVLVYALLLVVGLYVLVNQLAVRALGVLTLERNRELAVLLAVVAGLGASGAAHAAGLSPALGAFLAGMFLGGSPFATQVRADVASLRVVLLTLFFGAAGMAADLTWMLQQWPFVLLSTAALIVMKTVVVWLVLRWFGQPDANGFATGLCLAQIGEFAFVLGTIGRSSSVLSQDTHLLLVSTTIVSLFVTAYLVPAAPHVGCQLARLLGTAGTPGGTGAVRDGVTPPRVIIIGFGPAGQHVAEALFGFGGAVLVIDLNARAKDAAEAYGFQCLLGDATHLDVLEHAHVAAARLVVITVPAQTPAMTILCHVRHLAPGAHVIVRSRYNLHRAEFAQAGADEIVGDEEQVGNGLAGRVTERVRELLPELEREVPV